MEYVIKSREVSTLPFETKMENIILGFDMFYFEYPDKDYHVKDMGLNVWYDI